MEFEMERKNDWDTFKKDFPSFATEDAEKAYTMGWTDGYLRAQKERINSIA